MDVEVKKMILLRLRRLMERHFITQAELVRRTGIRGGTISDMLNSRCKMLPMDAVESICQILNVQPRDWIVFIPQNTEIKFWRRFVEEWTQAEVQTYPSDQYDFDWSVYEDFRQTCSILLGPRPNIEGILPKEVLDGIYKTGRPRKWMSLDELLLENGLHLDRRQTPAAVITVEEYFKRYETAAAHPDEPPYYQKLRTILVDTVPSFEDDAEIRMRKKEKLRKFWLANQDMKISDDEKNLIPSEMIGFLQRIEDRRR